MKVRLLYDAREVNRSVTLPNIYTYSDAVSGVSIYQHYLGSIGYTGQNSLNLHARSPAMRSLY